MAEMEMNGLIHHFFPDRAGNVTTDEEGEPMIGFYFQVADETGKTHSDLMGPYSSKGECEEACTKAIHQGTW